MIDLLLVEGDLPPTLRVASGHALIAQRLALRLSIHRGECPLDQSMGLDWLSWLAEKPVDLIRVGSEIRALVEGCPGVAELRDLDVSQVGEALVVAGLVRTEAGETMELAGSVTGGGPNLSVAVVRRRG